MLLAELRTAQAISWGKYKQHILSPDVRSGPAYGPKVRSGADEEEVGHQGKRHSPGPVGAFQCSGEAEQDQKEGRAGTGGEDSQGVQKMGGTPGQRRSRGKPKPGRGAR
ncbi:hypothetical protein NDU88_004502 [Pleurodeles waltl]|uniref:Uncharacterized protein n=1 Tax=Pleurodeles waltl TaxID=8319 RepID=A0AAV7M7P4_PLEWA|nr:hypothetical protein NDU88_004502 [Pleurodeles waltl]